MVSFYRVVLSARGGTKKKKKKKKKKKRGDHAYRDAFHRLVGASAIVDAKRGTSNASRVGARKHVVAGQVVAMALTGHAGTCHAARAVALALPTLAIAFSSVGVRPLASLIHAHVGQIRVDQALRDTLRARKKINNPLVRWRNATRSRASHNSPD
jgi:hypothetical protein